VPLASSQWIADKERWCCPVLVINPPFDVPDNTVTIGFQGRMALFVDGQAGL
jgi:hypothetical protein